MGRNISDEKKKERPRLSIVEATDKLRGDIVVPFHSRKDAVAMEAKRDAFLGALARGLSFTAARTAAGVAKSTIERWRKDDKRFEEAVAEACEAGSDLIEDALLEDAMQPNAWIAKLAVLKARRPNRWRENHKLEVSVQDDSTRAEKVAQMNAEISRLKSVLVPRVRELQQQQLAIEGEVIKQEGGR